MGFICLISFYYQIFCRHNLFIKIGLSWALGNCFTFILLLVLVFLNKSNLITPLNLLGLIGLMILLLTPTIVRNRQIFFNPCVLRKTNWIVLILFFWFFLPFLQSSLFSYLIDWDAVAIWFLKAKAFFYAENIWQTPFFQDAIAFRYAHKAYPPALPLLIAGYYKLIKTINDQAIQFYLSLFFLNLVFVCYGFVRETVKKLYSLTLILLTISVFIFPYLIVYGHNGYADVPLSFILTLCLILFIYGFGEKNKNHKVLYSTLIFIISGFGAMIKNEGAAFFAIITIVSGSMLFVKQYQSRLNQDQLNKRLNWKRIMAGAVIFISVLFPLALWHYFKIINHIEIDSYLNKAQFYHNMFFRIKLIFNLYLNEIIDTSKYGVLLIPSFFIFVITYTFLTIAKKIRFLIPSFILAAQLSVYTFVYAITNTPLDWQVLSSFDRLSLHLIPGFFVALVYQLIPTIKIIEDLMKKKDINA